MRLHKGKRKAITAPEAHVSHRTPQRLRVKIPSKMGDGGYFLSLKGGLSRCDCVEKFEVNALTGSILFTHKVDVEAIANYAEENDLFRLRRLDPRQTSLSSRITETFREISGKVVDFSGGGTDVADLAFLSLLGLGIFQIAKGNFLAPAWYTAFWYALNIFLKAQPGVSKGE